MHYYSQVTLGEHDRSEESKLFAHHRKKYRIAKIIVHPKFKLDLIHFDGETPAL